MNFSSRPAFLARVFSWRSARRALLALAILGTLIAAFYVVENIRGRRAWERTQALIAANGYTLPRTFAELAPPPVAPADNAAETPILRALYDPDPAIANAAISRLEIPFNDVITPAVLDQHAANLAELATALRRPHLRFPLDYEQGYSTTIQHVSALRSAARLLSARVNLRLMHADANGAADDTESLLRLAALLDQESLLISQLTTGAISELAVNAIVYGLARDAWSTDQRARFAAVLPRVDLLTGLRQAFIVEWSFASIYFDGHPDLRFVMAGDSTYSPFLDSLIPSGWFDQARALISRAYMESVLPSVDLGARRVDLQRLKKATREIHDQRRNIASGHALAALIFPTLDKVVSSQTERQTRLDHARLALTLADWREIHGTYPATLSELPAAAGVASLHDLITGEPHRYLPAPDRLSYRLYATGADARDDGGARPASTESQPADWVWPGGLAP